MRKQIMTDKAIVFHQACFPPIESLDKLKEFISNLRKKFEWDRVGLLTDERVNNQVYILLSNDLQASLRLNLSNHDISDALTLLTNNDEIIVCHLQGQIINKDNISSIASLFSIWTSCEQSTTLSVSQTINYISRSIEQRLDTGRGKKFSTSTINQVRQDSHGYCMFEGCGEKLDIDCLTGEVGNFAYMAHNVASSEAGPRGIPCLSEKLSDNPNNVLLLCDKHHRLIDKVACVDYPASKLTQMRKEFKINIEKLLEGLSFQPIPVFSVLWPVAGHVVSPPESRDIANSLSRLKARIKGTLNNLSGNERRYITKPEHFSKEMDEIVTEEAIMIINQTKDYGYRAALFAFGPMPALVGLGASLGNKSEITPMLRYRDGNCWVWPQNAQVTKPYKTNWVGDVNSSSEIILSVALTNLPKSQKNTVDNLGYPKIEIIANQMGNAALPHPKNGLELKAEIHSIFQNLHDKYNIKRVHLLVCASNAACVFIGQAFDLYQPELIVYDFEGGSMVPRLIITNNQGKTSLSLPNKKQQ